MYLTGNDPVKLAAGGLSRSSWAGYGPIGGIGVAGGPAPDASSGKSVSTMPGPLSVLGAAGTRWGQLAGLAGRCGLRYVRDWSSCPPGHDLVIAVLRCRISGI
jgi:hypothetical protein